jgi:hypothetical protein
VRAVKTKNVFQAEVALREMRAPSLLVALDYIVLLAQVKPAKAQLAALRWHGRLELEARAMTLEESRLALNLLEMLCAGDAEVLPVLHRLLRRVQPSVAPEIA